MIRLKEKNYGKVLYTITAVWILWWLFAVVCWGQVDRVRRDSVAVSHMGNAFRAGAIYYDATDTIAELQSEQGDPIDNVSITFQVNTGGEVYIDYGDGDGAQAITANGSNQTLTSNYSTVDSTYDIQIFGDLDSITKFSVTETYVTFNNLSDNIKLMTNLDYLYMRNCTGDAYAEDGDIPLGMTGTWYWWSLPELTANLTDAGIPTGLTGTWFWYDLPNLTATITDAGIPTGTWYWRNLPNLTATITDAGIPTGLTGTWSWYDLPNLTATITDAGIPTGLTGTWYWGNLPNLTANIDITDFPADITTTILLKILKNVDIDYTSGSLPAWSTTAITINTELTTTELDAFLNQYAIDAGTGEATLNFSDATRSEDSDAAVVTLNGKEKTIITTAGTEAP